MADRAEQWAAGERRVGRTIGGKFKLVRLLGVGGMAAVYEAAHRNGKRVALKLLHPSLAASERERKRFLREAYIANTIADPGVVPVFDDGIEGDDTFLVMELLEGQTVAALQKHRGGKLEPGLALSITDRLLDVLAAAHACGTVHRDIKPENLFLERSGGLRVLDFGIAHFEHVPGSTVDTQAGAMLGTPAFMSQEQARGRWAEVDERSDLWSAAATLFTLLSGQLVHTSETFNEQLGCAMTMPARSLATAWPEAPAGLVAVVDRALRFERNERFADARSMQAALRALALFDASTAVLAEHVQGAGAVPADTLTESTTFSGAAPALRGGAASDARASEVAGAGRTRAALARPALFALALAVLFALLVALRSTPVATDPLRASLIGREQSARAAALKSNATLAAEPVPTVSTVVPVQTQSVVVAPAASPLAPRRMVRRATSDAVRLTASAPSAPDPLDQRY